MVTPGIIYLIGMEIISLFIIAFILWKSSKVLKFKRNNFSYAFLVAAIYTVLSSIINFFEYWAYGTSIIYFKFMTFFILINIAILIFSIKIIYKIKWKETFITFLILLGTYVVLLILIGGIIFAVFGDKLLPLITSS